MDKNKEHSFIGEDGTDMSLAEMQDTYENERRLEEYSRTVGHERERIRIFKANRPLSPFSFLRENSEDALQRYSLIRRHLLDERLKKEHGLSEENEIYFFRIERAFELERAKLKNMGRSEVPCDVSRYDDAVTTSTLQFNSSSSQTDGRLGGNKKC